MIKYIHTDIGKSDWFSEHMVKWIEQSKHPVDYIEFREEEGVNETNKRK